MLLLLEYNIFVLFPPLKARDFLLNYRNVMHSFSSYVSATKITDDVVSCEIQDLQESVFMHKQLPENHNCVNC